MRGIWQYAPVSGLDTHLTLCTRMVDPQGYPRLDSLQLRAEAEIVHGWDENVAYNSSNDISCRLRQVDSTTRLDTDTSR